MVKAKSWLFLTLVAVILALAMTNPNAAFAADEKTFDAWLGDFRAKAIAAGISSETITAALDSVKPVPKVIELDRRQPEGTLTFQEYNERVLADTRVKKGQELYKKHQKLLKKVSKKFGVQPRFIVALWGIETNYGGFTGGQDVIPALATLAHEGRRAEFFTKELISALQILDEGHISVDKMRGSWAGAMGQCQFMPSSFRRFAIDFDGDGKRDIWNSLPDIFASIANYLAGSGWNDQYTWGREVRPAADNSVPPASKVALKVVKPLKEWQSLGVRRINGNALPRASIGASLLHTDEGQGPAYLVYNNFRVLMDWNRSTYFALTVGELADLIEKGGS